MRCRFGLIALPALAACPKQQTGTGTTPTAAGAGCPSGNGVYIASYVQQDPGKGRNGWVIPLHATAAAADTPEYAPIDPGTASAAGAPPAPTGTLWLASASGQPCRATVGKYYVAKIDGQGGAPASASYGVELEGCPAPANPDEAGGIVLVSNDAPTGCRFEAPQPAAARLGEMNAQKQWQRPTKETPIPPALAALVPAKECVAPACEKLWAFGEVKVNNQTVAWTGAVNWLAVGDPAQQCSWPAERFSGFFVPVEGGGAAKVTEGQTHALVLSAVLADGGGAKVILAEGPGEYATYDLAVAPTRLASEDATYRLAGGTARLAHAMSWMIAPDEAWEAVDHLGPICDPPR